MFSRFSQNLQSASFLLGFRIQRPTSLDHAHLIGTLDLANQRLTKLSANGLIVLTLAEYRFHARPLGYSLTTFG